MNIRGVLYLWILPLVLVGGYFPAVVGADESSTSFRDNTPVAARILFTGDTMLARYIGGQIAAREDPAYPYRRILDYLDTFDTVITNLECPLSFRGSDQGELYPFRADPTVAAGLVAANIGIVNLANNHVYDYGATAATDTIDHLDTAGIDYVGAGRTPEDATAPVLRNYRGVTVAFLGFTNLFAAYRPEQAQSFFIAPAKKETILTAVADARSQADIVCVQIHWGWEYETEARDSQRAFADEILAAGADLLVGHHPHVIQEYGPEGDGYVAYSLGNFIFDQNFSPETSRGMLLEVVFRENGAIEVEPQIVAFGPGYQPYLVE